MNRRAEQSVDFGPARAYLQHAIDERQIPGAVLRVEQHGDVVYEVALGLRHTAPERQMRSDTLFDIASLTKVVATLGTLLELFERGVVTPEQRLGEFLPVRADKQPLTLAQCLTHTSGLPAIILLQHSVMECDEVALAYPTGTQVIYSDLGFLLLGRVIEVITGQPLDVVVGENLRAWDMPDTGYNPHDTERCAATEWRDTLGRHQVGEVHDENAARLGGIAGQAGLFSTARDLAHYATRYLPGHASAWRERSHQCYTDGLNERRGLGWQLWTPDCFAGPLASPQGFGHTGFTGTSLWIDPERDLVIVLLTNRVHFGRQPHILTVRKRLHTLVYEALNERQ